MNRHSDVDLLVVKEGMHRRDLAGQIYGNLWGVGAAVDVVVVTLETWSNTRQPRAGHQARLEGRKDRL